MSIKNIEKPIFGYVVVTLALLAGMVAANAFGQTRWGRIAPQSSTNEIRPRLIPPISGEHRRWVLGVRAEPTDTGYRIDRVEIASAALLAGLERNDRIIAIDGQQVGYVGTKIIHLARVLDQKGGLDGRVQLLIQDHRTGRLVSRTTKLRRLMHHIGH